MAWAIGDGKDLSCNEILIIDVMVGHETSMHCFRRVVGIMSYY